MAIGTMDVRNSASTRGCMLLSVSLLQLRGKYPLHYHLRISPGLEGPTMSVYSSLKMTKIHSRLLLAIASPPEKERSMIIFRHVRLFDAIVFE
jgi:hypothetical protein